jgi:hypothetical protein
VLPLGAREYRVLISDALRDAVDDVWIPIEAIKLTFNGDVMEISLTNDLAHVKRAEKPPKVATQPNTGEPVRWRF